MGVPALNIFNAYKHAKNLSKQGFTEKQCEGIVQLIADVQHPQQDLSHLATREQLDSTRKQLEQQLDDFKSATKQQFDHIKEQMVTKAEFIEAISKLRNEFTDTFSKTRAEQSKWGISILLAIIGMFITIMIRTKGM